MKHRLASAETPTRRLNRLVAVMLVMILWMLIWDVHRILYQLFAGFIWLTLALDVLTLAERLRAQTTHLHVVAVLVVSVVACAIAVVTGDHISAVGAGVISVVVVWSKLQGSFGRSNHRPAN